MSSCAAVAVQTLTPTILCVDDEPSILSSLRRVFRGSGWTVLTAHSGDEALVLLASQPVDLVFSDMRMPGMDGVQLLEQVRAKSPNTVRVLLTGYADIGSTVAAINSGGIYRYISKPWNDGELVATARQVFEQQALRREAARLEALTHVQNEQLAELNRTLEMRVVERTDELSHANQKLKKSYLTSIKVFANLIELRGGKLAGHAKRVADLARRTVRAMGLGDAAQQEIFIAGILHDIGHIGLPDTILARAVPKLTDAEQTDYRAHALAGEHALMALEDLHPAALLIRSHHERFDGQGFPDRLVGGAIPIGARILAVADTYDDLMNGHLGGTGLSPIDARSLIARGRGTQFDPEVLDVFLQVLVAAEVTPATQPLMVPDSRLKPGMVLAADLLSPDGAMLLATDHVLTAEIIRRIQARAQRLGLPLIVAVKPPTPGRH